MNEKPAVTATWVGGGSGVVIVWLAGLIPAIETMPAEVGAVIGGLAAAILGPLYRWYLRRMA